MLRPVAEYCSNVYASMITKEDSMELERIQSQALKSIYGWNYSYNDLLIKSGLSRLEDRRKESFIAMAKKMSESPQYRHLFPRRPVRHNERHPGAEVFKMSF